MDEILSSIPQRPPFLFVDRIVEKGDGFILTQKDLTGEEDFFKGHFPGNPIMPGVLMQEAIFQTGALLMSSMGDGGLGVVTKVENAKFKGLVRPGSTLDMRVELTDNLANAYYFKGRIHVDGKTVMAINFQCALISE